MTDIENTEEPALVPVTNRAPVRPDSPTFAELGVRAETVEALAKAGITRAFAIQEYALPIALRGTDLIGQAPTGTGKTLGFGLPILERVTAPSEGADGQPQALIVVPTRELGLQVARDLAAAGSTRGVRVLPIYGGVAYEPQVDALKKGVEILVGTPGRLLDLAKQKTLKLASIKALVLDEADRMLDLGFLDDVERILAMLPEQRQTMLFSATMPDPIVALSRRFLRHPVTIHAGHTTESGPSPLTKQVVYRTHPLNKLEMVARILQARDRGLTMIFTRTKRAADRVAEDLDFRGFAVAAVHGDLGQGARERALRAFRTGKIDVLVATDVAARGLDVSGVTHVINYDCPEDPDTYTHRIGRTGRAGATGVAVTFVDWEDMPRWILIDKSMGLGMPQPPETYHTSSALYEDLDIPTDVSGTLPTAERNRAGLAAEVEEDLGGGRRRREGGRGRGGRSRSAGGPSTPGASPTETADRPKRQRRRRRLDESAVPGADEPTATTLPTAEEGDQPARTSRTRTRRRATDTATPIDSTAATPVDSTAAAPIASPTAEEGDQPATVTRTRSRRRATDTATPVDSTAAAPIASPTAEEGDRPTPATRTRSRRRATDTATPVASTTASPTAEESEPTAPATRARTRRKVADAVPPTGEEGEQPATATRTRRLSAPAAPVFTAPALTDGSDNALDAVGEDASRTRRRRRRGGSESDSDVSAGAGEMTGGSEAGVGTTAEV